MFNFNRIRVLFVCRANICRSPMAEAVLRQKVKEEKLRRKISVDSAAIEDWRVGNPPHPETIKILEQFHIDPGKMKSRQLTAKDGKKFDYIICMDQDVKEDALERIPSPYHDRVYLFNEFLGSDDDVLDPIITKDFLTTFDGIYEGVNAITETIVKERKLS